MQRFEHRISDIGTFSMNSSRETDSIISKLVECTSNLEENTSPTCEVVINAKSFRNEEHRKTYIDSLPKIEKRLQAHFESYCRKKGLDDKIREYYIRIKGYYVALINLVAANNDEIALSLYVEILPCTNERTVKGLLNWEDKYNELRTNLSSAKLQDAADGERDLPF